MDKTHCYLSTSCMGNIGLKDVLRRCEESGISKVELSAPHPYEPMDKIKRLLLDYRQKGFDFSIHNYFPPQERGFVLNIASLDDDIRARSKDLVEEALSLGRDIGSPLYGIHAGYLTDGDIGQDGYFKFKRKKNDYPRSLQQVASFIDSIFKRLNDNGITLILENLFPTARENYSLGCTLDEIKEIMSMVPDGVGLLLDLGHLNVSSYILHFDRSGFLKQYLSEFGERIYEVHFSENSGAGDEHLPLTKDSWQLKALQDIRAISFKNHPRIYCLEARKSADFDSLKMSMELIEKNINNLPLNQGAS